MAAISSVRVLRSFTSSLATAYLDVTLERTPTIFKFPRSDHLDTDLLQD